MMPFWTFFNTGPLPVLPSCCCLSPCVILAPRVPYCSLTLGCDQPDREAQRNIRRRTKEQIESLERQIQELTSQQPYQEFLAMKRAKEAVERENAEIKQRLAAIIGEVQSLVGPGEPRPPLKREVTYSNHETDAGRPYISPAQSHLSAPSSVPPAAPSSVHNVSTPGSAGSPGSTDLSQSQSWQSGNSPGPVIAPAQQKEQAKAQLNQQRHEMRHGLDMGPERLGLGFLLDSNQRVARMQNGANGAQDTARFQHTPMKHDWTDIRNNQALKARPTSNSTSIHWEASFRASDYRPHHHGDRQQQQQQVNDQGATYATRTAGSPQIRRSAAGEIPRYAMPIKKCEATCPLDSLLLDFLSERQQRVAEGLSTQEVVGPRYPSVSSLLNPAHSVQSHPLSKVFTDILSTFPDISTLPERVAVLYIMFLVMRWQISPTEENYERLPEWVRPQDSQLYVAHPAWMDNVPFPQMRDKLVREHHRNEYIFENFFVPFTTTVRLNWPYEETDTLLQSPDGDELMINPVFERHLRNLDNWTLGEPFAKEFPDLVEFCNIDYNIKGPKQR